MASHLPSLRVHSRVLLTRYASPAGQANRFGLALVDVLDLHALFRLSEDFKFPDCFVAVSPETFLYLTSRKLTSFQSKGMSPIFVCYRPLTFRRPGKESSTPSHKDPLSTSQVSLFSSVFLIWKKLAPLAMVFPSIVVAILYSRKVSNPL